MSKFEWTSLLAICCLVGLVQSDTEADGYSGEVKVLFEDLETEFTELKDNVNDAKGKMRDFSRNSIDEKYAIGLVNLYTQESDFFRTLNDEMRKSFPNKNTDIWRRSGILMNRGIDILGPTVHNELYRGCSKLMKTPIVGQDFNFNQITSTSLSIDTAKNFIECDESFIFYIRNVYGINIEKYSDFEEGEVLVKSTITFNVTDEGFKGKLKTYYLDGQSELYRRNGNSNTGFKERAGIILQFSIVAATILIFF